RVGVAEETSQLEMTQRVVTGQEILLVGRLVDHDETTARAEMEAQVDGHVVARLQRTFTLPTRGEFLARFGKDEVPVGLEGTLPP
ncbi:MAG: hypothetical protein R3185_04280, partial [Candidatus Thermoplasmatota archaeon]|nr:hypothetical protein [Candidatus Thermoplasmatota archaeon]